MNNIPILASGVVQKVIEVADVDGIVRQIDVNDVVQRIEWNDVVQRIEWNDIVQRIDWNELLLSIEWDQHMERIDFDTILSRVDTSSIIARSSTGIFTQFLDTLRTSLVMIDLHLIIITRCRFWHTQHRRRCILPPRPGTHRQRHDRQVYPKGRTNKAVAVQGRYCGFVSKAIAILLDILSITVLFALSFRLMEWSLVLFLGATKDEAVQKTNTFKNEQNGLTVVLYCIYWFGYFFLTVGLAGQTVGMMVVGLKVCDCNRSNPYASVSIGQAFLRTCLLPITVTLLPPLGVIGLIRRDGRMLHDLVSQTGLIYLWDAKLAKVRRKSMGIILRSDSAMTGSEVDEDVSDDLDDIMGDRAEEEEEEDGDDDNDNEEENGGGGGDEEERLLPPEQPQPLQDYPNRQQPYSEFPSLYSTFG